MIEFVTSVEPEVSVGTGLIDEMVNPIVQSPVVAGEKFTDNGYVPSDAIENVAV